MKTQEEIEQLIYGCFGEKEWDNVSTNAKLSLIQTYTQCQEDMADNAIKFAEWLVGDINGNGATKQQLQDNTTTDLYNIFLNKQDNEEI